MDSIPHIGAAKFFLSRIIHHQKGSEIPDSFFAKTSIFHIRKVPNLFAADIPVKLQTEIHKGINKKR